MKKLTLLATCMVLLLVSLRLGVTSVEASCDWSPTAGAITATTCGIDAQSTEAYDYSAGTDDATNGSTLTIPNAVSVTLNTGALGTPTTLYVGAITIIGTGSLIASGNYVQISSGYRCYVADADSDGYSPTPNVCSSTSGAGKIRKFSSGYKVGIDCGDGNSAAKLGQTVAQPGTFTNTATGLSGDWNCNGTETKTYPTANYSCGACTNGSGYASFINSTSGFLTSVPACGAAGTYYTVTNATCVDPAVANCAASASTSSVTQTCI